MSIFEHFCELDKQDLQALRVLAVKKRNSLENLYNKNTELKQYEAAKRNNTHYMRWNSIVENLTNEINKR